MSMMRVWATISPYMASMDMPMPAPKTRTGAVTVQSFTRAVEECNKRMDAALRSKGIKA